MTARIRKMVRFFWDPFLRTLRANKKTKRFVTMENCEIFTIGDSRATSLEIKERYISKKPPLRYLVDGGNRHRRFTRLGAPLSSFLKFLSANMPVLELCEATQAQANNPIQAVCPERGGQYLLPCLIEDRQ